MKLKNITVSASVLSLISFYILYIILRFYFSSWVCFTPLVISVSGYFWFDWLIDWLIDFIYHLTSFNQFFLLKYDGDDEDDNEASLCVTDRNARVVKGMSGILHNMLYRVAAARQPIRDEDAVNIFQRFRQCADSMIACKALILQACV